jgi:hypothetical protein
MGFFGNMHILLICVRADLILLSTGEDYRNYLPNIFLPPTVFFFYFSQRGGGEKLFFQD